MLSLDSELFEKCFHIPGGLKTMQQSSKTEPRSTRKGEEVEISTISSMGN
jgi:hypothetical protein